MNDLPLLDQKYHLSEDQLVRFREDGFLRASNVFDAATLHYFEPEITQLTLAHNHLDGTPMKERDTYSKAFIQVGNLWEKSEDARRLTFSKRLAGIATDKLLPIGQYCWSACQGVKPPDGSL